MTKHGFKQKDLELSWEEQQELERKRKENKGKQIDLNEIVEEE